jgi:putative methionine-R-sulfoxide reductase with GAF domain
MLKFFDKIKKIKTKLLIQFGLLLSLTVILMTVMLYSLNRIVNYTEVRRNTSELNITILQMRRAEKDFQLRDLTNEAFFETGQSKYISKFDELAAKANSYVKTLSETDAVKELNFQDSIKIVNNNLEEYSKAFHEMTDLYRKKGFKNWGDEGDLRKAIHKIEEGHQDYDKILMLTLRRHEKDFLLRKDQGYVAKFNASLEEFKKSLLASGANSEVIEDVNNYGEKFHKIVDSEKLLGFTDEEGIKGRLRSVIHKIEPAIENFSKTVREHVSSIINNTYVLLILLFTFQLITSVILSISFANSTTISIQMIKDRIVKLAEGVFPEKIVPKTKDEIGETSHSLNNLIDRIKTAADFSEKIGGGNLNIEYDKNFNNDVLAQSLQTMHHKLFEAAEDSQKRNWATTGLANFGDILRNTGMDLHELSSKILSSLVKYLGANQGQLYIVNEKSNKEEETLELMACYAWGKNKFVHNSIKIGEGLTGQAWIEKETIYLTDVPNEYTKITSGIGEANPTSVIIVPLKLNEEVFGILEIASLKILAKYQIEFVEKLAELIASTLSGVKINARTKALLQESQQQSEELRAQEEEMRQNQEEMQSTQEELNRQRRDMETRIKELEQEIIDLSNEIN